MDSTHFFPHSRMLSLLPCMCVTPLTFTVLPVSFLLFWSSDGVSKSRSKLSSLADLSQMMVFAAEPQAARAACALLKFAHARMHTHTSTRTNHSHSNYAAHSFEGRYTLQHTYTQRYSLLLTPPNQERRMLMGQSKCNLSVSICCDE